MLRREHCRCRWHFVCAMQSRSVYLACWCVRRQCSVGVSGVLLIKPNLLASRLLRGGVCGGGSESGFVRELSKLVEFTMYNGRGMTICKLCRFFLRCSPHVWSTLLRKNSWTNHKGALQIGKPNKTQNEKLKLISRRRQRQRTGAS